MSKKSYTTHVAVYVELSLPRASCSQSESDHDLDVRFDVKHMPEGCGYGLIPFLSPTTANPHYATEPGQRSGKRV